MSRAADSERLAYRGESSIPPHHYRVRLVFEAAMPNDNLYSLRVEATGWKKFMKPHELEASLQRTVDYWLREVQRVDEPDTDGASGERYQELVQAAAEQEAAAANPPVDHAGIAAIQRKIIDGMRAGRRFATAHKEGGTNITMHRGKWISQDYGESNDRRVFDDEAAFFEYLRKFYDWETRRDIYPHRPPEADAWRYILGKLM
ncbi:MAG: hypothetical protein R2729_31165 [Bryobacteraceae bacterium]